MLLPIVQSPWVISKCVLDFQGEEVALHSHHIVQDNEELALCQILINSFKLNSYLSIETSGCFPTPVCHRINFQK